jgi:hypothetical protein
MNFPEHYVASDNCLEYAYFSDYLGITMTNYWQNAEEIDAAILSILPHRVVVPHKKVTDFSDNWLADNTTGLWFFYHTENPLNLAFYFRNEEDAVAFAFAMS